MNKDFYKNKKVFITGHTGFKGTWLSRILVYLGADVYGYSLAPQPEQRLYELSGVKSHITSLYGDIRDLDKLRSFMTKIDPDIVLHLAAQPLVKQSYADPVNTYSINIMGTINVLEASRSCSNIRSIINVTTDKVYYNREITDGYKEDDTLNGYDPYSNSKSCSELVTSSYKNSFFKDTNIAVSTCRAGNVIGGGDFSENRIIPDCFRAAASGKPIVLRNPDSVRPYQHVLDPLFAYLLIAQKQYEDKTYYEDSYNIGPDKTDNTTTGELAELFCSEWGNGLSWIHQKEANAAHESKYLYLNCDKAKNILGWSPVWHIDTAIRKTVEWYLCFHQGGDVISCMKEQIDDFISDKER